MNINPYHVMDGNWGGWRRPSWFKNIDGDHPKNVFEIDHATKSWRRIWDNDASQWRALTEYEMLFPTGYEKS